MFKKFILSIIAVSSLSSVAISAPKSWSDVVDLVNIPSPPNIDPQIGAIGKLPNGNVIAAFHRGEVMVFSDGKWQMWASGLHEPLGMHVENQHSIVVVQRDCTRPHVFRHAEPCLARLRDQDRMARFRNLV